jgi:hypothetical protein
VPAGVGDDCRPAVSAELVTLGILMAGQLATTQPFLRLQ